MLPNHGWHVTAAKQRLAGDTALADRPSWPERVMETLDLAPKRKALDQVTVLHKPRLLSTNG